MASWYINPSLTSDTGTGSLVSPFRKIGQAESAAATGDEAVIIDGEHTLSADDIVTLTKLRTVRSQGGNRSNCIVKGAAYTRKIGLSLSTASATYTIRDVTVKETPSWFAFMNATNGILDFENMTFDDFKAANVAAGVLAISGTNVVNVIGNIIRKYKGIPSGTVGILFGSEAASWIGSTLNFTNNTLHFDAGSLPNTNRGLVSFNNGTFTGSEINFKNNVVFNEMTSGLAAVSAGASSISVSNLTNNFYPAPGAGAITQTAGTGTVTSFGNIAVDPLFNDAANGDYNPQAGSLLRQAGTLLA